MLIVCPSCASQYELDAAKIGPEGRKVRCASCKTLWHVEPAAVFPEGPSPEETQAALNAELEQAAAIAAQVSAVAAEHGENEDEEVAPAAPRRRAARRKATATPRGRRGPAALGAALTVAGVAVAGLLVWQREAAVRTAPQLAVVFEKLGMPVNVRGLSLTSVESGLVEDGTNRFLVVEGDVTNITKGSARVPLIEVAVKDAVGQTLYTWTTDPPRLDLEPAELMRFRARLASPPANGQSVTVRFTSAAPTSVASTH